MSDADNDMRDYLGMLHRNNLEPSFGSYMNGDVRPMIKEKMTVEHGIATVANMRERVACLSLDAIDNPNLAEKVEKVAEELILLHVQLGKVINALASSNFLLDGKVKDLRDTILNSMNENYKILDDRINSMRDVKSEK